MWYLGRTDEPTIQKNYFTDSKINDNNNNVAISSGTQLLVTTDCLLINFLWVAEDSTVLLREDA